MPETYKCAYCGTQQTWSGVGARVCSHCGATQPEKTEDLQEAAPPKSRAGLFAGVLVLVLLAVGGVLLYSRHAVTPGTPHVAPIVDGSAKASAGRLVKVLNPQVRVLPAGSDLSLMDLLRSAPGSTAAMFDTRMLTITQPRPMNDIDGHLYFVGEVVNHSPNTTAIAPAVGMTLYKGGRKLESTDLEFSDLPPGAHSPAFFTWDGDPRDIDHYQFHWKPVQAYAANAAERPRLETTISSKKMTPGTLQVNFGPIYHYVSADVTGTVVNRGGAIAKGIQLYLTLRDAQGRITGFKEQDLQQLAPGQSVDYTISADQWDGPVTGLDVRALPVSEPDF